MRTLFSIVCIAALVGVLGCKHFPTSPEPAKDPRTYTWTVDTLAYPGSFQTSMRDIWGSSPKDVYVVGHNDQNRGLMWHFDGKTWTDVRLSTTQGGAIVGPIDLSAIYGFSSKDIWVVGEHIYTNPKPPPNFLDSSLVIYFDGSKWTEAKNPRKRRLMSVWGASPNNLFVGGHEGAIMHYDGLRWTTQFLSPPAQLLYIGGDTNQLFAGGHLSGQRSNTGIAPDSIVAFTKGGDGWKLLDSQPFLSELPRFGESDFYSPTAGVYYSVGLGIFRWQNIKWEKIQSSEVYLNDIFGTGPNNIFATGQFGKAYHWNGNDWALLSLPFDKIPSDIWLTGVWTDGREAFICGHDTGGFQTFILHGK